MNPNNAYKWAATILFVVLLSGASATRAQQATNSVLQMPPYAYPFPAYPDPYAVCVTNNVAPVAFLDDYLWTNGEYSCSLRGFAADGQMWLQALVGAGEWSGVWHVSDRDGAMVTLDPEQTLDLSSFPRGIYQVQLGLDATTNLLPTLWVAWPSNAVPACRFPAAGNVHGKIVKMRACDHKVIQDLTAGTRY